MRALRTLLALTALAVLAIPAAASASTLTRAGGVYDYTGTASINSVNVTGQPSLFNISDAETITMAADASCTGENTTNVVCTVTPTSFDFDLGGNNDGATINMSGITTPFPITGQTGSGNDSASVTAFFAGGPASTATLNDSSGNDILGLQVTWVNGLNTAAYGTVNGGTGDDDVSGTATVNGDSGNDKLRGFTPGSGNVTLNGGTENDTFNLTDQSAPEIVNGGSGTDTVDYGNAGAVTATMDSVQNDGVTGGGQTDNANADGSIETIITGNGTDNITGGPLGESILTKEGNDTINAGGGDDYMDPGVGGDVVNGGTSGAVGDTLDYQSRSNPLRVTPDAIAANDGEAGENDNVGADVENLIGGFGNDQFESNGTNNNYSSGVGNDTLEGGNGNDTLLGGFGDDQISGEANNDTITAGQGNDTIDAGADTDTVDGETGADLIDGDSGTDTLNGGAGSDTILSRDNQADTVNCGTATDHSVHDVAGDTVNADCEISDTGAAGFGAAIGPVGPGAEQTVAGNTQLAVVTCSSKRGKRTGKVRVACTIALTEANKGGTLRARLMRGGRTFAKARRTGSGRVTLRSKRRAKPGRYTLVVTHAGKTVARVPIRVR